MSHPPPAGVVVDTNVISWMFDERPNALAERYRHLIGPRPVVLSFQSVMELRFGVLRANWGELRRRRLERRLSSLVVVQPDDRMLTICAELRARCERMGHGLGAQAHEGDRWIAATAIRLGVALVSHDGIFAGVPGLELLQTDPR